MRLKKAFLPVLAVFIPVWAFAGVSATLESTTTHPDIYLDYWGTSVAADGDEVLIGAENLEVGFSEYRGRAFLFRRTGSTWNQTQQFDGDYPNGSSDAFGAGGALLGDMISIGAPDEFRPPAGSIYAYQRTAYGIWTRTGVLSKEMNVQNSGSFARDLSMNGSVMAAGDPEWREQGTSNAGASYVYRWGGSSWTREHFDSLPISITFNGSERLGEAVSTDGTQALFGAPGLDDLNEIGNVREYGGALLYTDSSGTWNLTNVFRPPASYKEEGMQFGQEVLVSGTKAFITARDGRSYEPLYPGYFDGGVFVYEFGTTWTLTGEIVAPGSAVRQQTEFGSQLALDGNLLAVGSFQDSEDSTNSGAVYVYREDSPGTWTLALRLAPPTPVANGNFGKHLSMKDSTLVVSEPGSNSNEGTVYIYRVTDTGPTGTPTPSPTPTPIPTSYAAIRLQGLGGVQALAYDINESTRISGEAEVSVSGPAHATRFEVAPVDLGTLGVDMVSAGNAINDSGVVAGYSGADAFTDVKPVRWDAGGTGSYLSRLGGGSEASASDIESSGTIVGWGKDGSGLHQPVKWSPLGAISALPLLSGGTEGEAIGINDSGEIVGWSSSSLGDRQPVRWPAGGGIVELSNGPPMT